MVIDEFQGAYRWLSNFWPCTLVGSNGLKYPSVEHAYQACKYPVGSEAHEAIRTAATAGQSKRIAYTFDGRTPDERWNQIKVGLMYRLLKLKFVQGSPLARKLLATDPHELVEGNKHGDRFWGVCRGKGENTLGKLLMTVRNELKGP